eukprot:27024-Pyramimonas_sp.AAC.1
MRRRRRRRKKRRREEKEEVEEEDACCAIVTQGVRAMPCCAMLFALAGEQTRRPSRKPPSQNKINDIFRSRFGFVAGQ